MWGFYSWWIFPAIGLVMCLAINGDVGIFLHHQGVRVHAYEGTSLTFVQTFAMPGDHQSGAVCWRTWTSRSLSSPGRPGSSFR